MRTENRIEQKNRSEKGRIENRIENRTDYD